MIRRNTPAKQAVLKVLTASSFALSQEDIEQQLLATMDRATVYRILKAFHDDNIIHKVIADDGKQYFALCHDCQNSHHQHNHFHFQCVSCDKVTCLDEQVHVQIPKGYTIQNVQCMLTGKCPTCA